MKSTHDNSDSFKYIPPNLYHLSIPDILSNTDDCVPCRYNNPENNANGSPTDFLCSVYFNKILGLFPYVRTFRHSNKQSKIIVLINKNGLGQINKLDKKALIACGVTLVSTGQVENHCRGLQIVRLLYFYEFLQTHLNQFRRCIFTDGFDVFFQGDPFTTEFLEDHIYLTLENETNNFLNNSYFEKFPTSYKIICSKNIINCGVMAGGTSLIYQFFTYYLQMFPGIMGIESQAGNYYEPYSDQDALNYFVYIWLPKYKIYQAIEFIPSAGRFSSMIGEIRYHGKVSWEFPHFSIYSLTQGKMIRPLLVHQYTYSPDVTNSLIRHCGLLKHQKNPADYYRIFERKKR